MDRYYVVQTQPQRERLAAQELRNQSFETFYPQLCHPPRMTRGRFEAPVPSPLFPKYLFVRLDLALDNWRSINGTRGVVRLMGMDAEKPSPVPRHAMDRLLTAGEMIEAETSALPFQPGDTAAFVEGPMTGLRGIVQLCEMDRVTLLLNMLGGQRTVRCSPALLKYASVQAVIA